MMAILAELEAAKKEKNARAAEAQQPMQSSAIAPIMGLGTQVGGAAAGNYVANQIAGSAPDALASAIDTSSFSQGALDQAAYNAPAMGVDTASPLAQDALGSAAPYLGVAGTALGAYNAYKGIKDGSPVQAGLGGLGAVGGLNALGYTLGPWGVAASIGLPVAASLLGGAFDQKSTKEYQAERWGALADKGITSAKDFEHDPNDDSIYDANQGPRAGQKWNFQNALGDAKVDPRHFAGVLGNFETFGNDWTKLGHQQRDTIVSQLANQGLYDSSKGDVRITDAAKAKQIYDDVLANKIELLNIDPNSAWKSNVDGQIVEHMPEGLTPAPAPQQGDGPRTGGPLRTPRRRRGGRLPPMENPFLNQPDPNIISQQIDFPVTSSQSFGQQVANVYTQNAINPLDYRI